MCGITGIFHYSSALDVDADNLAQMRASLQHRGPDGQGMYIGKDRKVGLASVRLAIRDLSSAGDQPLIDSAAGLAIVFNGEIYNADALREDLKRKGATFRSSSDTEVLLSAYRHYGEDLLHEINGIFAFAILDERRNALFLARDHLGVKPLYYLDLGGTFAFASEPKALCKLRGVTPQVNHDAVASYLTFACCPGPQTLFADVLKLAPATMLRVGANGPGAARRYWSPIRPGLIEAMARASEQECIARVREGIRSAVKMQLAGDVPATCSLSGGVDSSTVASLMSSYGAERSTFFTIGFGDDWRQYNEYSYAQTVARHAQAELIEVRATPDDVLAFLQTTYAEACDDPNADPVCPLAFFLAQQMRWRGFKVALSGEGADEVFLGYERYLLELSSWARLRSSGSPLADTSYWGLAIPFPAQTLPELLTPDFAARHFDPDRHAEPILRAHQHSATLIDKGDLERRVSFLELQRRLPELLLMRVDKMSMANSVEYRVPFLDKELVELAFAIPSEWKLKGERPKSILKDAVEGIIPPANIHRKKMGFALPIAEWLKDSHVGPRFTALLARSPLVSREIIRPKAVRRLIEEHQSGAADRHFELWTLLTLSLWYERWAR